MLVETTEEADAADGRAGELVVRLAERLGAAGLSLAVAESLTGGLLSSHVAAGEQASEWFRGGLVAYAAEVKRSLLHIGDLPVVSQEAAEDMANAVARLLGADVSVAVTGVGGPGPADGVPAGTVWMAAHGPQGTAARLVRLDGSPVEVCQQACVASLGLLLDHLDDLGRSQP